MTTSMPSFYWRSKTTKYSIFKYSVWKRAQSNKKSRLKASLCALTRSFKIKRATSFAYHIMTMVSSRSSHFQWRRKCLISLGTSTIRLVSISSLNLHSTLTILSYTACFWMNLPSSWISMIPQRKTTGISNTTLLSRISSKRQSS